MDRIRQDVRFAIRSLINSPLVTTAAVLSLGLGIGANASIFSAIDVFMIRPLEFEQADNLVVVWTTNRQRGWNSFSSSVPDYLDWRRESRTMDLAAWGGGGVNLTGRDEPERLTVYRVTPNFFDVLRKRPVVGRGFRAAEEQAGGPNVVILGDGLWQRSFGGDPGVVGRTINLNGDPYQVIGIMPPRVDFQRDPDLWLPMRFAGDELRGTRFLQILGRIRDGQDLNAARTEMNAIQARLSAAFPASNAGNGARLERLQDDWFDEGFRQGSLIAGTAVLFVLLIACSNVANLLLARAAGREREIALRGALGAGRVRILRQMFTENMVLALAGGVLGLMLAVAGVPGIRALFPPGMRGVNGIALNARVVVFTMAVSIFSGMLFGLAPAVRTARLNLRDLLTDGGRGNTVTRGGRLRTGLVIAEISLSLVLLVASTLLVEAFVKLRRADLGFRVKDVVTMSLTLPTAQYRDAEHVAAFQSQLLDRIGQLPGVVDAGGTSILPMHGNTGTAYTVPGEPAPEPGREPVVSVRTVTPGYFEAIGIRQVSGRSFTRSDTRNAPGVVVINELMAARHWPGQSAIGQRLRFDSTQYEVVGVVANTRDAGPDDEPDRMVYFSAYQSEVRTLNLAIHTSLPPDRVAESIRAAVRALDPQQPVYNLNTLEGTLRNEIAGSLAMAKVLGVLALIAFILAGVGVYGVMAYSVTQRTMEMGIRMALGAQPVNVLGLVLRRGALITGAGVAIGLGMALSVTRLLSFFLYGVSPFNPLAFTIVPLLLVLTGMFATWVPARRATRVDPVRALRID